MDISKIDVRKVVFAADGIIDMEIRHPVHGWIPFTASPNDSVQHGRELHAKALAGDFGAIAEYIAPPVVVTVPRSVSRFQALAALHTAGLLPAVQAIMDLPETDAIAKIAWNNAQAFERDSITVAAFAEVIGLSDNQLDDLFIAASKISA